MMADIVHLRTAGWTWDAIYFHFLRRRVKTSDGREWSRTTIRRAYATEVELRLRKAEKADGAVVTALT